MKAEDEDSEPPPAPPPPPPLRRTFNQLKCNQNSSSWTVSSVLLVTLLQTLILQSVQCAWQENLLAKVRINQLSDSDVQRFSGNLSYPDHFKLLEKYEDSFLIGGRNIVYNLSLISLEENKRLEWYPGEDDIRLCKLKGKSENDCHNYIRVLAIKKSDREILVCGTNAFKPRCRHYVQTIGGYEMRKEISGEGLCPYDPHHNSTAVFAAKDGEEKSENNLYVATVAGFSGSDPLIYREPLRTEQFNPKHLNAPSFVSSFHHEDHVYFFFREIAVEYINCGKTIYSRVARVCTKDKGGPHKLKKHWTSFLKARLNCSVPGDFPFDFNEIQSTTDIVDGFYNGQQQKLIYGVFTTPANSIGGSAVCAFRMQDIHEAFKGPFKGQEDSNSNWLQVQGSKVPEPRPGTCVNDSTQLPENTLNFLKDHTLMDMAVPAFWKSPIVIQTSLRYRFTKIAVDPQLETATGETYDVLFIGTDDGRVLKAINSASYATKGHFRHDQVVPVIIEDINVFPNKIPITNLMVYRTYFQQKLIVVTDTEIKTIPLSKCGSRAKTCGKCVGLQDPYCAWDIAEQKCTSSRKRYWNRDNFVQNIEDGWDPKCPDGRPSLSSRGGGSGGQENSNSDRVPPQSGPHVDTKSPNGDLDQDERDSSSSSSSGSGGGQGGPSGSGPGGNGADGLNTAHLYTAETLAFSVVTSVVTSLVIGFIFGYIFSRRCRKDDPNICSPYDDPTIYLDHHHHHHLNQHHTYNHNPSHHLPRQLTQFGSGGGGGGGLGGPDHNTYVGLTTGLPNNKPINLVLNVPPKNGKNANSSADNKPIQKVKKMYL